MTAALYLLTSFSAVAFFNSSYVFHFLQNAWTFLFSHTRIIVIFKLSDAQMREVAKWNVGLNLKCVLYLRSFRVDECELWREYVLLINLTFLFVIVTIMIAKLCAEKNWLRWITVLVLGFRTGCTTEEILIVSLDGYVFTFLCVLIRGRP